MAVERCRLVCTARLPEVSVVFQPVLCVRDLSVYRYEALCRTAGDVAAVFAEEVRGSFAQELDREVCRRAAAAFARSGRGLLFVNLTLLTFLSPDGVANVLSGLPRRGVVVEVTEQAFDTVPGAMRRAADWWRQRAFLLAVDGVGSGQSRVLALAEMVPDFVKVDRPLVAGARETRAGSTVLSHVIALAQSLGAWVVAEGVETEEELELVGEPGFDLMQGYLLGRPGPLGWAGTGGVRSKEGGGADACAALGSACGAQARRMRVGADSRIRTGRPGAFWVVRNPLYRQVPRPRHLTCAQRACEQALPGWSARLTERLVRWTKGGHGMNSGVPRGSEEFLVALGPATVRAYREDLRDFARWFEGTNGRALEPGLVTTVDLREYQQHMLAVRGAEAGHRQPAAVRG